MLSDGTQLLHGLASCFTPAHLTIAQPGLTQQEATTEQSCFSVLLPVSRVISQHDLAWCFFALPLSAYADADGLLDRGIRIFDDIMQPQPELVSPCSFEVQ